MPFAKPSCHSRQTSSVVCTSCSASLSTTCTAPAYGQGAPMQIAGLRAAFRSHAHNAIVQWWDPLKQRPCKCRSEFRYPCIVLKPTEAFRLPYLSHDVEWHIHPPRGWEASLGMRGAAWVKLSDEALHAGLRRQVAQADTHWVLMSCMDTNARSAGIP